MILKYLSDLPGTYRVNFARSGDPNGNGLPEWQAFTEDHQQAMMFDQDPGARAVPNLEKLQAFDSYYAWRRGNIRNNSAR